MDSGGGAAVEVGDDFDALFRRDFVPIARTVYLIVGDRRIAEEITQEAFAKAWSRWTRVRHHQRPGAWVQTVAVRMALRDKTRRAHGATLEASTSVRLFADADESVVGIVDLLRTLTPMQRAVIALAALADLPIHDVADRLGCRPATARVHLHRARQRLGALLEEANHAN